MTEELRDVLLARFTSVYSGYGATDIEIGMAGESPVSIAVRRLARARPDIRRALFGTDARLPMVFQYNPLIHYLEVNDARRGALYRQPARPPGAADPLQRPRCRGRSSTTPRSRRVLAEYGFDLDRLGDIT